MRGYIGPDDVLTLTAPAGGVRADVPVLIGELAVVPVADAAAGELFAGRRRGVVAFPKANVAMAEGEAVFWSLRVSRVVKTDGSFTIGHVVRAAMASDTHVRIALPERSEQVPS